MMKQRTMLSFGNQATTRIVPATELPIRYDYDLVKATTTFLFATQPPSSLSSSDLTINRSFSSFSNKRMALFHTGHLGSYDGLSQNSKRRRLEKVKPKARAQKKFVSFAMDRTGRCGLQQHNEVRAHHYTEDDIQNAWYSPREYKEFIRDCRLVLERVDEAGGDLKRLELASNDTTSGSKEEVVCIRGLEDQIVPRVHRLKRKRRRDLIQKVVQQHAWHKQLHIMMTMGGCTNDSVNTRIREVSLSLSAVSARWAVELGAFDETYVRTYYT